MFLCDLGFYKRSQGEDKASLLSAALLVALVVCKETTLITSSGDGMSH